MSVKTLETTITVNYLYAPADSTLEEADLTIAFDVSATWTRFDAWRWHKTSNFRVTDYPEGYNTHEKERAMEEITDAFHGGDYSDDILEQIEDAAVVMEEANADNDNE